MSYTATAVIASNGQITLPAAIRERLGVKEGDRLSFALADSGELTVTAIHRRSIFEDLDALQLPSLGRPLTQKDIDDAIGEEMKAQELRIRNQNT
ncbi:MAG TPA: AbrB/MazE/SpoVT family DNA-binding domain-containing protein [Rhodopseudomonas sp.]|uniref:AbrB/MazE/SpoVT family DNA-binding domain-containing protein n=1 Tax=Rhodopseudomonas sp. TaxID=1078 RepID=UPI002ED83505